MESRSSHFIVGLFVLLGALIIAAMGVWFAKADIDRTFDDYDVVFTGSVNGLQEGAPVKLRGVPVGRVMTIRIDEDNIEEILATIEVDAGTPINADTRATLAMQGVTGLASIELKGGRQSSPSLEAQAEQDRPRILSSRSAIEKVFESTPELLSNAVTLLARLEALLSDENLDSVAHILDNLEQVSAGMGDEEKGVEAILANTAAATDALGMAVSQTRLQLASIDELVITLTRESEAFLQAGTGAMTEGQAAAEALQRVAGNLRETMTNLERPLDDFGQSGLYDFTEMVRELRQLVASMTRITKEFERDPAGFLIGGNQRGFTPQ